MDRGQSGTPEKLKRKQQARQADQSQVFRCLSSFELIGRERPKDWASKNGTVQLEEQREGMILLNVCGDSSWLSESFNNLY